MSDGYDALLRGAAWLDLSARGRTLVRGRDRARLLHNISSNEIKKLAPGNGCYAFLLNAQGRIQADLTLLCFDDRFLIDVEPELREKVPQHIRRYIVADQVELEDVTDQTAAIGLEGPGAAAVLASLNVPVPGADYAHVPWGENTVAAVSLTGQPGFRIYCAAARKDEIAGHLAAAGAKPATADEARVVRLEIGKPRYGEDIRDTTLPQETGQMHAISFTKGCYIGQEIVERIRSLGHVNKQLARVEADAAEALAPGTKLTAESGDAGEITSSVWSPRFSKVIALAFVRAPFAESGKALQAGDIEVRVA
ncbi:MAG TPA: glycine cleavage T C-terminal barrel domain-containing protein [Bryobacteraceae bacterium]|jgi:aminomethyltransferase